VSNAVLSSHDYQYALDQMHALQEQLFRLADLKGTMDPEVIALSQVVDGYVVRVQKYWLHGNPWVI